MSGSAKFLTYCGMTNLGGSEKRECKCVGPNDCEMRSHPDFTHYRNEAISRMHRALHAAHERFAPYKEFSELHDFMKHPFHGSTVSELARVIVAKVEELEKK